MEPQVAFVRSPSLGEIVRAHGDGIASRAAVAVRHAEPSDADALHEIFSDPQVAQWLADVPYVSAAQTREQITAPSAGRYMLVACVEGRVGGALALTVNAAPRLRHGARIGPVAVARRDQGRGIGAALMRAAIDLADNWLALVRLDLLVATDNAPAIALYEKCGFVIEGTQRAFAWQGGRYVDAHVMARVRLAHDPFSMRSALHASACARAA